MSYWIPARELYIVWGNDTRYWRWISFPPEEEEVAELFEVCWLEIRGRVQLKKLLLKTSYSAYLVFKLNKEGCYGLRKAMAEVGIVDEGYSCSVFIDREKIPGEGGAGFPQPWGKEWMEIKLGEFFNNLQGAGGDNGAEAALLGVQQDQWKSGLIVKGIHFRPNYY